MFLQKSTEFKAIHKQKFGQIHFGLFEV